MKLIIDIPYGLKDVYEHGNVTALDVEEMRRAIINGTPLPKGHGKIGDFDAFLKGFLFDKRADNLECGWIRELIEQVTIIEADKESEDKTE